MHARLEKLWTETRDSYWFVPSVMALGAVALAVGATSLDAKLGAAWMEKVEWLYANKPEGARAVLSTIAGSMITVAGVTFSITIAAVVYATSLYGPRLLTNFMRDRGNQFTLGTFIATFLYCLLVLRTIRSADEMPVGAAAADLTGAFVPHVAILVGLILGTLSVGVLIYFIHHVPESIHVSNVVANVGRALNRKIDDLFPETVGLNPPDHDYDPEAQDVPEDLLGRAVAVEADGSGYVQHIHEEGLFRLASKHDLIVRLEYGPGDFVMPGKPLLYAFPAERADEEVQEALRRTFVWGRERTQEQDILFLANEPVEIAARALSPGTNDPFTAITCMDWIGSALINMARREPPTVYRYEDGHLRLIARPVTFEKLAQTMLGQLRPYAKKDINAALHLMKIIAEVAQAAASPAQRRVLLRHGTMLLEDARGALEHESSLPTLEIRYEVLQEILAHPERARDLMDTNEWLGGMS